VEGPKRLSADDARLLELDSAAIAGHTLKIDELGPGDAPVDVDRLRERVDAGLEPGSRARERLAPPEPHRATDDAWKKP
jgi:diacylglycerol O-acyltransferase / wax synthase